MLCNSLTRKQSNSLYLEVLNGGDQQAMRRLCREDLFFLLTIGFRRKDVNRQWLYERCREVEKHPNGHLDLWAREHYKSTIITYAKGIQDILASHGDDPLPIWNGQETTMGIFSHTRPIAKGFLDQIKRELETNDYLKDLFPDVLYKEPRRESPSWSLDGGIMVKRKSNPKEKTVEAHGLVDGQPTSKHFLILNYDDVVTRESVTTPDQIKKVTDAWALSLSLGADGGVQRYIGTRYHYNDTYRAMIERESAIPRIHAATSNGKVDGEPVLIAKADLQKKRRDMGPYVYACQLLQNPKEDSVMGFKEEWLTFYDKLRNFDDWNFYMLVDPASKKKKENDYTVIVVIGLGPDKNYYLVDAVRDRLNLTERTNKLFEFHRRYRPLAVGYEEYGLQADVEHVEYVMEERNYRFKITRLGGSMPKEDRIRRLVPVFEQHRFWLPHNLLFVNSEKIAKDFIREFIESEYLAFPVAVHDDMMDCIARVVDPLLNAQFPEEVKCIRSVTMNTEPDKVQTDYKLFP